MRNSFVLLAQLLVCTNGITGRKKLQKMVHILQTKGVNFGFDFRLALYGAYSTDLRCQVEELVQYDLVEEVSPYNNFVAKDKLFAALSALNESPTPDWKDLAIRLNEKSARELEGVSTVLFLEKAGLTGSDLKEQFQAIKPHLSDEFDDAASFASAFLAA